MWRYDVKAILWCQRRVVEDIPRSSHSPKGEWQHMRFMINTVLWSRGVWHTFGSSTHPAALHLSSIHNSLIGHSPWSERHIPPLLFPMIPTSFATHHCILTTFSVLHMQWSQKWTPASSITSQCGWFQLLSKTFSKDFIDRNPQIFNWINLPKLKIFIKGENFHWREFLDMKIFVEQVTHY